MTQPSCHVPTDGSAAAPIDAVWQGVARACQRLIHNAFSDGDVEAVLAGNAAENGGEPLHACLVVFDAVATMTWRWLERKAPDGLGPAGIRLMGRLERVFKEAADAWPYAQDGEAAGLALGRMLDAMRGADGCGDTWPRGADVAEAFFDARFGAGQGRTTLDAFEAAARVGEAGPAAVAGLWGANFTAWNAGTPTPAGVAWLLAGTRLRIGAERRASIQANGAWSDHRWRAFLDRLTVTVAGWDEGQAQAFRDALAGAVRAVDEANAESHEPAFDGAMQGLDAAVQAGLAMRAAHRRLVEGDSATRRRRLA